MKVDNKKYIIAVSGGPDSMALLDLFKSRVVGVCHVNYHKRKDSNKDMQIVINYCNDHNLDLAIYDVDRKLYKSAKQHNFQALARDIRYQFFVQCATRFKCNNLLIAHNLNDFLETAIMQENRKSINFYYGIKPRSTYQTINIYRPLINEFKSDLEKYCKQHHIAYAIDSSNALDIYERNRIRKQLTKWPRAKLMDKFQKIQERNKVQAKLERQVLNQLAKWQKSKYEVNFINGLRSKLVSGIIYLYLKNNKIININYNKIKLVRDFIVSKKSNHCLRLETNVYLQKKNKHIKIIRMR